MGAGWCPPGMLGIGIGGTAEKAMLLAKEVADGADRHARDSRRAGRRTGSRSCALEIYDKVNALGIGAQGLGGLTTVLDVKIKDYPTHAASQAGRDHSRTAPPRGTRISCSTAQGPAELEPPDLDDWPKSLEAAPEARRVNLDTLTRARRRRRGNPARRLLLNGKLLTGRDAAHKRISRPVRARASRCPRVDFTNRVIYYVGPVDPVRDEVVGPAGPTTATRMDKFTEMMLDKTGLIGMIGKARARPGRDRSDHASTRRSI